MRGQESPTPNRVVENTTRWARVSGAVSFFRLDCVTDTAPGARSSPHLTPPMQRRPSARLALLTRRLVPKVTTTCEGKMPLSKIWNTTLREMMP